MVFSPLGIPALELFCGIGGFAAAVADSNVRVVAALDQSPAALAAYQYNYPDHPARSCDLEKITATELTGYAADLWWLSPPCQPYSVRGHRHDLDDPRARSLCRLLDVMGEMAPDALPRHLALENVPGFADSQARDRLTVLLAGRHYEFCERLLCPTQLGIPSRRPRYYLVASRSGLEPARPVVAHPRVLTDFLDPHLNEAPPAGLLVDPDLVARFGEGFRILDPEDPHAYTTCFTAGYGKSLMHAGSYLICRNGVRRFAPHEIAALLGFPVAFDFPGDVPLRKRWHLLGNSLSVIAVREVLRAIGELKLAD